ncbi:MAG: chorismate mutase, partial [Clostridia bacterium]|nr:chorismate mutase [Clostridia bacterium]
MNQLKLLTHIISTCDDALAETFQKRMDIAAMMAETRRDLNEEIFDEAAETAYVRSVAAQFPPELLLKANSLWSTITRMHRGQQYRWTLKHNTEHKLPHELAVTDTEAEGIVVCPAHQVEDVAATLNLQVTPCASVDEALDMVERGEAAHAAFSISNTHDLSDVYLRFYKRDLYLNHSFRPYV